jgi:S1-C subfamily serine protease
VRVRDVLPDSPAEQAGIKSKDILLSINDRRVESNAQLTTALRQLPPDSEVVIRLKRENEYKQIKAKLVPAPALEPNQVIPALVNRLEKMKSQLNALPANDPARPSLQGKVETLDSVIKGVVQPAPPEVKLRVFYGFEAQALSAQLLAHFSVPHGVLVASVADGGRAAQGGLQAGDVIVNVGEKAINDLAALLQALDETKESATLTVQRRRETLTVKIPH